jgi:hypothetical protein
MSRSFAEETAWYRRQFGAELLDTPRRVNFALTHSKQRMGAIITRHTFPVSINRHFGKFRALDQRAAHTAYLELIPALDRRCGPMITIRRWSKCAERGELA